MLDGLRGGVDRLMQRVLVGLMGLLVVDVLWQVFTRLVLRDPSSFTDELAGFLFIWVGLLGAAYVTGQRKHIAIDLLPSRMGPVGERRLRRLADAMVLLFSIAILVVGGGRLVFITLITEQLSPTMGIPLGYVYTAVPLAGVLMVFYSMVNMMGRGTTEVVVASSPTETADNGGEA